jgi:hypothetical protein
MSESLNREAWLQAAVQKLRPVFLGHGYTVPELRVSVGWPSSGGLGKKEQDDWSMLVWQHGYGRQAPAFISPLLDNPSEPYGVLPVLIHEMAHVVAGPDAARSEVREDVTKLGLEGKPTSRLPAMT